MMITNMMALHHTIPDDHVISIKPAPLGNAGGEDSTELSVSPLVGWVLLTHHLRHLPPQAGNAHHPECCPMRSWVQVWLSCLLQTSLQPDQPPIWPYGQLGDA